MKNVGLIGTLMLFCVIIACIVGYGKNVYKLANCDFASPYKCEVIHAVGIIPVVGVFTGYMDFGQ
jgi:hypothetical protein